MNIANSTVSSIFSLHKTSLHHRLISTEKYLVHSILYVLLSLSHRFFLPQISQFYIPWTSVCNSFTQLHVIKKSFWFLGWGLGFFPSGFWGLIFFPCGAFIILSTWKWKNENSNCVADHGNHGLSIINRDESCVAWTLSNGSHRSFFWSTRYSGVDGGFSFNYFWWEQRMTYKILDTYGGNQLKYK